jgi:hypothetical protein
MCPHSYNDPDRFLHLLTKSLAISNEQIAVLQAEHIQYINLRSVWGMPGTSLSFCLRRDKGSSTAFSLRLQA